MAGRNEGHDTRLARGLAAERLAERFLAASGYRILGRNVRYRHGEIDLVAEDPGEEGRVPVLVFVEVRARRAGSRVAAEATIGPAKMRSLAWAAARWQRENGRANDETRFDLLAMTIGRSGTRVRHILGFFVVPDEAD